jgi:hypothetical protein
MRELVYDIIANVSVFKIKLGNFTLEFSMSHVKKTFEFLETASHVRIYFFKRHMHHAFLF